jgi:WD40 repeat protein
MVILALLLTSGLLPNGLFAGDLVLLVSAYWDRSVLKYDANTGEYLGKFIASGYGDLSLPECMVLRPGGEFYIASVGYDGRPHTVKKYDYQTGAFLGDFATGGGLDSPRGILFGPDNNLYVCSDYSHEVLRYDGQTGAFMDAFVAAGSGGLTHARDLLFWHDSLYVSSSGTDNILRYDASTGGFFGVFASSPYLDGPQSIALGADGLLYVSSGATDSIVRFNMQTGAYVDVFVSPNSGGLDNPNGLVFAPNGDLLVASHLTHEVLRYDGQTGAFVGVFASEGLNYPTYMLIVPEPGTLALLALAGLALGRRRSARRGGRACGAHDQVLRERSRSRLVGRTH